MAVCPENIDEWLLNVPNLLEDEGWQLGHESPAGKLWKQSCPWGGHLVRLSLGYSVVFCFLLFGFLGSYFIIRNPKP